MLVLRLLEAGVRVVQLKPVEQVYDEKSDAMHLMMMVVELSRGNSESVMKSERCGEKWQEKKRDAAVSKLPMSHIVPAWLEVVDRPLKAKRNCGRFVVRKDAAATVRRIYRLAREGMSVKAITRTLASDGTPTISGRHGKGKGRAWNNAYVLSILSNPAVYGFFQPGKGSHRHGKPIVPDGPPIPDYFPPVISEDEYHATRLVVEGRRTARGRPSKSVNIFKGLLMDAATRTSLHFMSRQGRPAVYCPAAFRQGGCRFTSFSAQVLEDAILSRLVEIDPAEVVGGGENKVDEADALAGRLAALDAKIEKIKKRLAGDEDEDAILDVLKSLTRERREVDEKFKGLQREAASPVSAALMDCRTLIKAVKSAPDQEAARTKLRQLIRRIVKEVWVCVKRDGHCRQVDALVDVHFATGVVRTYHVGWMPTNGVREEKWAAGAFDRCNEKTMRDDPAIVEMWLAGSKKRATVPA
jgi:hypothetical protein